jgi:DNA (cytosine-5)-methyltransferase 1
LKILDLFAGCGGMSLGFKMAGFKVPLANEIDLWAGDTYEANHPETKLIRADIRTIQNWKHELGSQEIDGIVGGPPCQAYSLSGDRDPKDPRASLFMDFAKCVEQVNPKFFVMENVPGILSAKTASNKNVAKIVISTLSSMGYDVVSYEILNAVNYGVPQIRNRVFFIGFRNDLSGKEWVTPAKTKKFPIPVTVDMAISDLPQIGSGEGEEEQDYPLMPQNSYQQWVRGDNLYVHNHIAMRHSQRLIDRFKVIGSGQNISDVPDEHSAVQRGDPSKKSGKVFSQNNMRVFGDKPSPTVPASFQSNFIHPHLDRNFTAREGARLQSFPDWYIFKGKRTVMSWEKHLSQYEQIGNAVPPLLAKAIAENVIEYLSQEGC